MAPGLALPGLSGRLGAAAHHQHSTAQQRGPLYGGLVRCVQSPASSSLKAARQPSRVTTLGAATLEQAAVAPSTAPTEVLPDVQDAPPSGRLLNNSTSFMECHRIRSYEVGPDQRTTIVTIANLLQEVAGNHAVALWGRTDEGFATDPIMVEHKLIFAATRIQIQMDNYPKWGDVVQIETWFDQEGRIAMKRSWELKDATTGREFGRATSTWVMVNTETRRLAKLPEAMREKLDCYKPNPSRPDIPPHQTRLKLPDLSLPPEMEGPVQVARRSDMDMNGHINNVTYLAWALETVPFDTYNGGQLAEVEIDFKAECKAGDTVESLGCRLPTPPPPQHVNGASANGASPYLNGATPSMNGSTPPYEKKTGPRFLHVLRRCDESGCVELVRARSTWRLQR